MRKTGNPENFGPLYTHGSSERRNLEAEGYQVGILETTARKYRNDGPPSVRNHTTWHYTDVSLGHVATRHGVTV